jgi:multiple sugar transport system permease protein
MAGLLVFTAVPIVWGLVLSLQDARGTIYGQKWIGLTNYANILNDPAFVDSLKTVSIFAVLIVPTTFALGLALALLVNSARHGQAFFRSVFFVPTACSYVCASLIWRMGLFNGVRFGIANTVLGTFFGIDPIAWTFSSPYRWVVLVSVRLWLQLGLVMILFLAGLQEIPTTLYEAARVDGAEHGWATFRHITFPLLRNTSIFVLFIQVIAAFQAFDEFYNVLGTGQSGSSAGFGARPPLWYLYDMAFGQQDYGMATAGAFIVAGLILIVSIAQIRVFGLGRSEQG